MNLFKSINGFNQPVEREADCEARVVHVEKRCHQRRLF